jgi:predicted nucleic acid-binding Zn ribbon protein
MPIYEYRRPDGSTFEVQQAFSEESLSEDPDTGVPVERVLHAPAVHFKGKGFYNTDYGTRKRQRETAASADGSASGGASTGDSSTDSSASGGSDSPSQSDSVAKTDTKQSDSSSKPEKKVADAKPLAAAK